jgi:hypothetical protein
MNARMSARSVIFCEAFNLDIEIVVERLFQKIAANRLMIPLTRAIH